MPNMACRLHMHNLCGSSLHTQHFLYTLGTLRIILVIVFIIFSTCFHQLAHACHVFLFSSQVKLQLYNSREILADNSSDRMHRHSHISNIQQSVSAVSLQIPSILRCVTWDCTGNSVVHNSTHGPDAALSYSSLVVSNREYVVSNAITAIRSSDSNLCFPSGEHRSSCCCATRR